LFTLLLAAGGTAGIDIPALGYLLSMLFLLAFAVCCLGLSAQVEGNAPWLGLGAVVLTFACPVTTYGLGTEMPLLMFLAWGSWWAAARARWLVAALLAGLAAVTRGDGVLVGVALALVFVVTHRTTCLKQWPWGAPALYLLVVIPWYLFAWAYFGSPLPATLGAKLAQGSTPGTPSFVEGLAFFWQRSFGGVAVLWLAALALVVVGLVSAARLESRLAPAWVWSMLFVVGFGLLNVPRYPWYYSPLVPVVMLALVFGGSGAAGFVAQRLMRSSRSGMAARAIGLVTAAVVAFVFLANDVRAQRPEPSPRSQLYRQVGEWLEANTPPGASVGAEEVGFLGYYSRRRIIDFVGLIQPDVAPYRARGDNLYAMEKYEPDYVVALPTWRDAVGAHPWVAERYEQMRTFERPGSDPLTLFRKK
jgi:hypothetical protein